MFNEPKKSLGKIRKFLSDCSGGLRLEEIEPA